MCIQMAFVSHRNRFWILCSFGIGMGRCQPHDAQWSTWEGSPNAFSTLSATDHFFRAIQVVGILIASIMLVLLNSQTTLAFRCILVGGVITTILSFADVKPQWGISFIGGIEALLVNAIAYSYVSWLMRKINNTQPPAPHETRKERGSGEPRICK